MAPPSPSSRKNSATSLKMRGSIELETITEHEEAAGLDRLKTVTTRLRLTTRRPSILEWKANVKQTMLSPHLSPQSQLVMNGLNGDNIDGGDEDHQEGKSETEERTYEQRRAHIEASLEWIRTELRAMKTQDHRLAMQLMRLRADIQQIKLQKTSSEHRDLIDNSAYSVEEESELMKSGIFDLSLIMPTMNNNNYECMSIVDKPLKDMGVTRMNLNRRRFSLR